MKRLTVLTAILLLLSIAGTAQQKRENALVGKMLQTHHPVLRNDIAPEKAIYTTQDGCTFITKSDLFSYDEDEHLLLSVETLLNDLGAWIPYALQTYEYDMYSNVSEILTQSWDDDWTNQSRVTMEYQGSGSPLLSKEVFQNWENDSWVNVQQYIYSYDPVVTVLVKDWLGDHYGNHYLYTFESDGDVTTVLLQFWKEGAWQNQEIDIYSFDDLGQIKERIHRVWVNNTEWVNETEYLYQYDGPYQLSSVTIIQWEDGEWSNDLVKTILYTHDGMGNSLQAESTSNYYAGEALNADIELFYNEGESITYKQVFEVEMSYLDLTHLGEASAERPLTLCPNPASDRVVVRGEGFGHAEVYSLTGQLLMESRTPNMELQGLASGAYLVKLYRLDGGTEVQKLLVQ